MIWKMAGVIGVDPRPFTIYQLATMYDGALDSFWTAVSSISFTVASAFCDTKRKKIKPEDFNWYAASKKKQKRR